MPLTPEPTRPISLTGIKPTGVPHLGNYVGAIRPAIALAERYDAYYFIADYHALTTVRDPEQLDYYSRSVAASWLACGLDPNTTTFYRQSDCPETFELTWILACVTAKGLMNRAHAYKAARDRNREAGLKDLDAGVNMGTYNYPVLMAADILIMQADVVPVGKDQVQHVEYARDIAERFNVLYGDHYAIKLPRNITSEQEDENALPGLDGRKMSKSYGNTIPLFCDRDELRRLVRRLKSDSTPVDAPKDPDSSTLFAIYAQFASEREQSEIRKRLLAGGLGWGEMKEILFERLDAFLSDPRKRYNALMEDRKALDEILELGAEKARARAQVLLTATRAATGIR
jgi:tryptophanyl-tRNA synthetase